MALVPSPTRSRQRAWLADSARSLPDWREVRINTLDGVQSFVMMACYNRRIGLVVEDITISLPSGEGYPAQVLRAALGLIPNIECLVLNLPSESPITLLNQFSFTNLRIFSTNLPHRGLASFLYAHTLLTALILGSCGRSTTCLLQGLELRALESLQCPARCFIGIIAGPLVTATVNLTRLTSMSSLAIQNISSPRLHTLTVDHFSNDYDVLSRVATAVPNLRKLKLNEKPTSERGDGRHHRPWNDLRAWHHTLLQLPYLEELFMRTLISVAAPTSTERDVVIGWAEGVGQRAIAHPKLYHIALMQKNVSGEHQLSHWFKKGVRGTEIWTLVSIAGVGRHETFTL
ncbi:hypothetical protein C8Q70DRAFT_1058313 [Cubamyces menziesii]|uniref:Uncharacterized protein n=1 Tax=Trametes cubensis TaxID=1111947 RepID=A0AAD7TGH2_9APHY|nr:hypothetical protein C8Q70DRAFT_1058313 [Cubamyces menziesii]KAJ8456629.1 hypothetical protein ONZ51_g12004 [Trametes cubensis]